MKMIYLERITSNSGIKNEIKRPLRVMCRMQKITNLVEKYDNIDLADIFRVNVKFSGAVCLLQIGVMLGFYYDKGSLDDVHAFFGGIPVTLLIFLSGLFVLIRQRFVKEIFQIHAFFALLLAAFALIAVVPFVLQGIPEGSFRWSFGLPTVIIVYGIYLFRIGWLADWVDKYWFVKYSHVIAGAFVALSELIIFIYLIKSFYK